VEKMNINEEVVIPPSDAVKRKIGRALAEAHHEKVGVLEKESEREIHPQSLAEVAKQPRPVQ